MRHRPHPRWKRRQRIKNSGEGREHGGNRPHEPLRRRSQPQDQAAAEDADGYAEEKQHQEKGKEQNAVVCEREAECRGR